MTSFAYLPTVFHIEPNMFTQRIIINADDLGLNNQVNEQIFDLINRGRVTSSTILANGLAVKEAARLSKKFTKISFGIHLNATQFAPITRGLKLAPILDQYGNFNGNKLREIKITRELKMALFEEWSAQIQRLIDLGVSISHIDSHHHVHTIPAVFPILHKLMRHFGINRVRISMNMYPPEQTTVHFLLVKKYLWNNFLRYFNGAVTVYGFTSLQDFLKIADSKVLDFPTVELMIHPGNPLFSEETVLASGCWENNLQHKIKLISYRDL